MSETLKDLLEYLQNKIDSGEHKIFFNDLGWEVKTIDCINAINEQQEEIERLNNIINDLLDRQNEALRYIGNHLSLDSRYKHGNGDEELILVRKILNKHIKELNCTKESQSDAIKNNDEAIKG